MRTPYIHTNDGISVVLRGRPYHAAKDDSIYDQIVEQVETGTDEDSILWTFETAARRLKEATGLTPDMLYSGGVIRYKGEVLHNYAADRLIALIEAGRDHAPLANFLGKLQANPSFTVRERLYAFLEHGNIPLTASGDFLAYKAVRENFQDIHSGHFDNSIGANPRMERRDVDENQDRTCSAGLHVCSFGYLPHFSHANGHVMLVQVNPANVVAIPADYNNTKMRVSEYRVVGEVEGYYNDHQDVLGDIGRKDGVAGMFTLVDEEDENLGEFFTLEESKRQAQRLRENDGSSCVYVLDDEGMVVWTINREGDEY